MTEVIIIAAGAGHRWADYGGVPKHLAQIAGETLIERTARLARANGATRVHMVAPSGDERYRLPEVLLHGVPAGDSPPGNGVTKFLNTSPWWSRTNRTVILYGDVWFSDDAMARIMAAPAREWITWCRPHGSKITGKAAGEVFAVSFWPEHQDRYRRVLEHVADLDGRGVLPRSGGWEAYRSWCQVPDARLSAHRMYGSHQVIDDWTEDFDTPEDFNSWRGRRERRVSVLIPYRPDSPQREEAFAAVFAWWQQARPGWEIVVGQHYESQRWIKGCALQDAARKATGAVFVIADADVWVDPGAVDAAVDAVLQGAGWAMPHTFVHRLTADTTEAVFCGGQLSASLPFEERPYVGQSAGGIVVIPATTWRRVPMDPRFVGWGDEDRAWALALTTLAGPVERVDAVLFHLWHPPQPRLTRDLGSLRSRELYDRYAEAAGDQAAMAALVEEYAPKERPVYSYQNRNNPNDIRTFAEPNARLDALPNWSRCETPEGSAEAVQEAAGRAAAERASIEQAAGFRADTELAEASSKAAAARAAKEHTGSQPPTQTLAHSAPAGSNPEEGVLERLRPGRAAKEQAAATAASADGVLKSQKVDGSNPAAVGKEAAAELARQQDANPPDGSMGVLKRGKDQQAINADEKPVPVDETEGIISRGGGAATGNSGPTVTETPAGDAGDPDAEGGAEDEQGDGDQGAEDEGAEGGEGGEGGDDKPERPADSANKPEWVAYARAVDPELSEEDANALTKPKLIEKYGADK